jgi:hypothetical protein
MTMNTTHDSKPLLSLVALVALGAFAAAAGCDSSRAQAITATGAQVDNGGVDFSDPFGGCTLGGDHFPLECSQRGAPCTGGSEGTLCGPGGCSPETFHVMCDHTCQVDADCPIPATGDSRPVCQTEFHFCQLPCGGTTTCPVGYTCQASEPWLPHDGAGNPLGLPMLCMQTITITRPDGGTN